MPPGGAVSILQGMRRSVPKDINAPFERAPDQVRHCQHAGCPAHGAYRAPVARDRLNEYYWFCLEHVRAYNLAWDFFAGMNEAEIERQRRWDTVWQRPSWPLGQFGERAGRGTRYQFRDGFGFYTEGTTGDGRPPAQSEGQKALALLDLKEPVTFEVVKSRYITLVKQLHPDANGGDVEAEERLKIVNQAYAALKISFA